MQEPFLGCCALLSCVGQSGRPIFASPNSVVGADSSVNSFPMLDALWHTASSQTQPHRSKRIYASSPAAPLQAVPSPINLRRHVEPDADNDSIASDASPLSCSPNRPLSRLLRRSLHHPPRYTRRLLTLSVEQQTGNLSYLLPISVERRHLINSCASSWP